MPDLNEIYQSGAVSYHELVSREDYQNNLLPAILSIDPLREKDVIELGAGTGRLSCLIAPLVSHLFAGDRSLAMLKYSKWHLGALRLNNWHLSLESHLALPYKNNCADVVIAAWSFCYTAIDAGENWKNGLEKGLSEVNRILRPGGKVILIESLGTGFEKPHTPDVLVNYLRYLDKSGFKTTWIRTDYLFKDLAEAKELTTFFFGDQIMPLRETDKGVIVPECTGLWWKEIE